MSDKIIDFVSLNSLFRLSIMVTKAKIAKIPHFIKIFNNKYWTKKYLLMKALVNQKYNKSESLSQNINWGFTESY